MKLSNIGNILLKIFAGIFTLISSYLICINVLSNYGRLFPMNRVIVLVGGNSNNISIIFIKNVI